MKSRETNLPENNPRPLPKTFYLQDTPDVARALLGKGLFVKAKRNVLLAEIVEVEAYLGEKDPASHAHRGPTKRSWPMFEEGGTCYVYLSYGINLCMNVVTGEKGVGEACLLRAAIPRAGAEVMIRRRKIAQLENLMSGPGKLTQALGINLKYNGLRFDQSDFKLVDLGVRLPSSSIGVSTRIGISKAKELPLRFFVKESKFLSRKG